jgi:hypothetical protein
MSSSVDIREEEETKITKVKGSMMKSENPQIAKRSPGSYKKEVPKETVLSEG